MVAITAEEEWIIDPDLSTAGIITYTDDDDYTTTSTHQL